MNVFKGTFTAATSTGNQTISGIGFTPKAVILWTSYQTGTGFTDGYQFQIGMTDGTNQNSFAVISDENSPNDTDRGKSEAQLIFIRNVAGTTIRLATIVSLGSGQFVINWSVADANAVIFHFVALGGDELSVAVGSDTDSPSSYSSVTFGDCDLALYAVSATSGDSCTGPNVGWACMGDPTITQGSACAQVRDAQTASITGRYQRTNSCLSIFNSGAQTIVSECVQRGLRLGVVTGGLSASVAAHFLILSGIAAKAGSGLQPTSTGNQAITGLGFRPKGVFLLSVGQTAQTTVQTEARFSLGAADGTNQGWAFTGAVEAVDPIRTAIGHSTTNVITCSTPAATGSSTTTEAQASLASLDADGFTLNWGTADATQREYLWVAFGDAAEVPFLPLYHYRRGQLQ